MKRTAGFLLFLSLLFSVALAVEPTTGLDGAPAESPQTLRGFVIPNDVFFEMENAFRQSDFSGDMARVTLSETQTLVFNPTQVNRLLPNLMVTLTGAEPFAEDADVLAATFGSLIETMQYLQGQFPETFLFHQEMAAGYADVGLRYAVSEPEIWLWPESAGVVFIPVCFYENEGGTLIDNMYLLEVSAAGGGALSYMLYNNPRYVAAYMAHVTIGADNSPFQRVLAFWYLQNYLMAQEEPSAVSDAVIGTVRVIIENGYVRSSSDTASTVVMYVGLGEEYPVLSVAENGWYQIRREDGVKGYISPMIVEFVGIE